ncbi:MAG: hypothetical protein WBA12_14815, partial [Catalinimonas sp.]
FYNVVFNQTQTATRTYTLLSQLRVAENFVVGNGATLSTNGQNVTLGNSTNVEILRVDAGGTLDVQAGSTVDISVRPTGSVLDVSGTLKLVGASGNAATVTRTTSGGTPYGVIVRSGATLHARHYEISHISNDGLQVLSGATVDPTNNFSDGLWSDMSGGGTDPRYYLSMAADASALNDISNVTFSLDATPVVGRTYNVLRPTGSVGTMRFVEPVNGPLGSAAYEDDPDGLVEWPATSSVTWTGAESSDWHDPRNWTPNVVPTGTVDALIPLRTNNPNVVAADATCKALTLTDGVLTVADGRTLTTTDDVLIGTTTGAVLAVGGTGGVIRVGGNWTRQSSSTFVNGGGTVYFDGAMGTFTISPRTSPFYNLVFAGAGTFILNGAEIEVENDLSLNGGELRFDDGGYLLTLGGDYVRDGGTFDASIGGTVRLNGTDQSITNGNFHDLELAGNGTKTTTGPTTLTGTLLIEENSTLAAGASCDFNDNVTIEVGSTFQDGGQTHTFSGFRWTGAGQYAGTGEVIFDHTNNQEIAASTFHDLRFENTGRVTLVGDVDVTGDVYVGNTINTLYLEQYLIRNTAGAGTFTVEEDEGVNVEGANNFPAGFSRYELHVNSVVRYNGLTDQQIAPVTYGHLYLYNENTKTLTGNTRVAHNLLFERATLD